MEHPDDSINFNLRRSSATLPFLVFTAEGKGWENTHPPAGIATPGFKHRESAPPEGRELGSGSRTLARQGNTISAAGARIEEEQSNLETVEK